MMPALPLLAGPLLAGPLLAGPLLAGPLLAGPGLQPGQRGRAVGHHAVVGDAAVGPDPGRHVVGGAMAEAAVQVGADHAVPVAREPVAELTVKLVPARQVVHRHDPRHRLVPGRPDDIGVDLVSVTAGVGDHLRREAVAGVGPERVPHG